MFRLHETTRILLCRSLFVLLCVVPTAGVVGATWHFRSDQYTEAQREDWIAVLADKLNVDVEIRKLSYPLWNVALLEDVALIDPESATTLAKARFVEVETTEQGWHVAASHADLDGDRIHSLVEILESRVLRGRAIRLAPLMFQANQVTLTHHVLAQTFEDVRAEIVSASDGKQAKLQFRVAGAKNEKLATLTVSRQFGERLPRTVVSLDTQGQALPCAPLTGLLPSLERLGDTAEFRGEAQFTWSDSQRRCDLKGTFHHVDLASLLENKAAQRLVVGTADVFFHELAISEGVITTARGTVRSTSQQNSISRPLLETIAERLQLAPARTVAKRDDVVSFSRLAFGFDLNARGMLSISGVADPPYDGAIMTGKDGTLLAESGSGEIPATALVGIVSPDSHLEVPLSPEGKNLLYFLPLPSKEQRSVGLRPWMWLKKQR